MLDDIIHHENFRAIKKTMKLIPGHMFCWSAYPLSGTKSKTNPLFYDPQFVLDCPIFTPTLL